MLDLFLKIFLTIFVVMDPLGAVPLFISIAGNLDEARKRATIRKAILISFVVMSVFILGGRFILGFFGISPGSFSVAGGILFFLISIDMLFGQTKRARTSSEEEGDEYLQSIAVFPLAIPYISGPGLITTIMLYAAGPTPFLQTTLMLFVSIVLCLVAMFASLSASSLILRVLGKTGVSVIERIMGLLLSGLSIQFVYEGLLKLGVLPPLPLH
ncbi:MAG TPA: MarC family protein [Rectinemataceae bacterium]|nr:MarC family protein [Rectinemataceae bacterium]